MILANITRLRQKLRLWPVYLNPKHYTISSQDQDLIFKLKSCTQTSEISQIHGYMVKTGLDQVPFTLGKLLASSIQDMQYAASIFNHIQNPNLFMFNTVLRGYSISDDPKQAFVVFNDLRAQESMPDEFSFVATLKSCARELGIGFGKGIHGVVLRSGFGVFDNVKNTILQFYCVCEEIRDARQVFDEFPQQNDSVSWNTLMGGYLRVSKPLVVVDLFRDVLWNGLKVTAGTILSVVSASSDLGNFLGGESVHCYCIKIGFCYDLNVVTALIDMYAKVGCIDAGRRIFDGVAEKDVVLWSCLIDGYAKSGMLEEALSLLRLMKAERVKPNSSTVVGLLSACAASGSLNIGKCINDYVNEEKLVLDAILGTALVDMYAKCGVLAKAVDIFDRMESKDVKAWTSMISGYGVHGQAKKAIALFYTMEEQGIRPNEVTFLTVLSACSHGGLVTEAMRCFERMVKKYGYSPKVEHYGCMIDLLGRAGLLEEAHKLIKSLPVKDDATAWRALLASCRVYGNVELGECVKRVLIEICDEHPTDAMLITSTYAIAGRLPDYTRTHEMHEIREEKMMKEAGCSTVEMYSQGW